MVQTIAKDVRRRCAQVVEALDIPHPFDLDEFRRRLEIQRGRPLQLVPIQAEPDSPCGLWVGMAEADYVFYEAGTTPLHQVHIILHELGHLILDHRGASWVEEELANALMPDLSPALIKRMLGRTAYSETEEQEAETFASLVLERANISRPEESGSSNSDVAAVMARVASVFGHPSEA